MHAELRAEEGARNSGEPVEGVLTDADAAGIVLDEDGVRDGDRIPFAEVSGGPSRRLPALTGADVRL